MRTIKKRKWQPAIVGPHGPTGRRVFVISWRNSTNYMLRGWACKERGTSVCIWSRAGETKRDFVERCAAWVSGYPLSQLVVRTKRGTIAFERTYPRASDPKRRPG